MQFVAFHKIKIVLNNSSYMFNGIMQSINETLRILKNLNNKIIKILTAAPSTSQNSTMDIEA